jgi:hypothetical protein
MKFNWSLLLLVALLVVVAYKAGEMREGFFVTAYDGIGMAVSAILIFVVIMVIVMPMMR